MPPTYSLVGDYFPEPARRARAMSIYMLASPVSALVSFVLGGWLCEHFGWRIALFVMGAPALLMAMLVKMTIADPRLRMGFPQLVDRRSATMRSVLIALWSQSSSRHLTVAVILLCSMGLGLAPWYAAFMERSHGVGTAELGIWLGAVFGIGGMVGTLLGGYVSVRWFASNEQWQMRCCAITVAALVPCYVLFLFLPDMKGALGALALLMAAGTFMYGPTFALLQRLVADSIRSTSLAVVMLLANLIGMGLGPQIVGVLSDCFKPTLGADSLRYAMMIMSLVALWAAYHFWRVGTSVKADLLTVETEQD